MNVELLTSGINDTIAKWVAIVDNYCLDILVKKPHPESWSLGQVVMHIVTETGFYIKEINNCLGSDENSSGQMTQEAKSMFEQNAFPDIKIQRDASLSEWHPQPESKPDLQEKLNKLNADLHHLLTRMEDSGLAGKTMHPGLGNFNAQQWVQFAEMHMRHHLRQKERIEDELKLC